MSLAEKVEYRENMIVTTKEKGLWNSALPIAFHRSIHDVPRCKTFTEVIVTDRTLARQLGAPRVGLSRSWVA